MIDLLHYSWLTFCDDLGIRDPNGVEVTMDDYELTERYEKHKISLKIARQEQILALCSTSLPEELLRVIWRFLQR